MKRLVSLLLVVTLLITTVFCVSFTASAETAADAYSEKNDVSLSTLDEMGFADLNEDGDFKQNPTLTKDYSVLNEVNELYVQYNADYGNGEVIRDNLSFGSHKDGDSVGAYQQYGFSNTKLTEAHGNSKGSWGNDTNYSKKISTSAEISYATSVAFDAGNGKNDYVATLQLVPTSTGRGTFDVKLLVEHFDSKGLIKSSSTKLETINSSTAPGLCTSGLDFQNHEYDALVEINAGDFDGNGKDEIAVFYGTNKIKVYSINPSTTAPTTVSSMQLNGGSGSSDDFRTGYESVALTMATGDFDNDFKDELAIATSFKIDKDTTNNTSQAENSYAYVYDYKNSDFVNDFEYSLAITSDTVLKAASVAAGDVTGDGIPELFIAGYDCKIVDLDKRNDWDKFTIVPVIYNNGYNAGAVSQKTVRKKGEYTSAYSNNYGAYSSPIPLAVANLGGASKDTTNYVFADEAAYNATVSNSQITISDTANYISYQMDQRAQNDSDTDKRQRWISSVTVGNFDGNSQNRDQILVVVANRQEGDTQRYWYQTAVLYMNDSNEIKLDHELTICQSTSYNRSKDKKVVSTYFAVAKPDVDEDSVLLKYLGHTAYYSKPQVNAILQSAPYFADLAEIDGNYLNNGGTSYTISSGETKNGTFECGGTFGFKANGSVSFGVEAEIEASIAVTFDFEYQNTVSETYEKTYTGDAGDDYVVLYTVPYNVYQYAAFYREGLGAKVPGDSSFNSSSTFSEALSNAKRSENYEEEDGFKNYEQWVELNKDYLGLSAEGMWSKGYKPGTDAPSSYFFLIIEEPLPATTSILTVDQYDEIAERTKGFDTIRGNVLLSTPGEPSSYETIPSCYGNIRKASKDKFKVTNAAGSSITASYTHEVENSYQFAGGIEHEGSALVGAGFLGNGAKAGLTWGAYAKGGGGFSDISGTSFEFCVDALPAKTKEMNTDAYSFSWQPYIADVEINGGKAPVLYYNISNLLELPKMPRNLAVSDVSTTTNTLVWDHSLSASSYEIYTVTDNGQELFLKSISAKDVNGNKIVYEIDGLSPSTRYNYKVRSVNAMGKKSSLSPMVSATTLSEGSNGFGITKQPADVEAAKNTSAVFTVEAYPSETAKYQWQQYDTDSGTWVNVDNQRSSALRITATQELDGARFRCTVYENPQNVIYSMPATLTLGKTATSTAFSMYDSHNMALKSGSTIKAESTETTYFTQSVVEDVTATVKVNGVTYEYYSLVKDDTVGGNGQLLRDTSTGKFYNFSTSDGVCTVNTDTPYTINSSPYFTASTSDYSFDAFSLGEQDLSLTTTVTIRGTNEQKELNVVKVHSVCGAQPSSDATPLLAKGSTGYIYVDDKGDYYFATNVATKVELEKLVPNVNGMVIYPVIASQETRQIKIPMIATYPGDIVSFRSYTTVVDENTSPSNGKGYVKFKNVETGDVQTVPTTYSKGSMIVNHSFTEPGVYVVSMCYSGSELYRASESDTAILYVTATGDKATQDGLVISGGVISIGDSIDLNPSLIKNGVGSSVSPKYTVKDESGNAASGISGNIFTPTQAGTFTVTATASGYTATSRITVKKVDVVVSANNVSIPANASSTKKTAALTFKVDGAGSDWNNNAIKVTSTGTSTTTAGTYTITPAANTTKSGKTAYEQMSKKYNIKFKTGVLTLTEPEYTITVENNKGTSDITVTPNIEGAEAQYISSGDTVVKGSTVQISNVTNPGYTFTGWTVNGTDSQTSSVLVLDNITANTTVKANYASVVYTKEYTVKYGELTAVYTSNPCNANPTITGDTVLEKGKDYVIEYYTINSDGKIGNKCNTPINVGKYLFVISAIGSAASGEYGFAGGKPDTIIGEIAEDFIETYKCSNILTIKTTDVHSHKFVPSVTTEPSCTVTGVRTFACDCGESYTEDIAAKGHSFGNWKDVVSDTCGGDSYSQRVCSVCNATETINMHAEAHAWSNEYTIDKEAKCTEDGSKSIHCTKCDATQYSTVVPANGHNYSEWTDTVSETCGGDSYSSRICSVCKAEEKINVHAEGHVWDAQYTVDKEATCTEEGSKSIHCSKCNATQYSTTIPAKGHSFGEWEDITADTCGGDSYSQRTCSVCSTTETMNIHAENHKWDTSYTTDKEATCTEDGSKSIHCTNCDAAQYSTTIPAKGHSFGELTEVTADVCGGESYSIRTCSVCKAEEKTNIHAEAHKWNTEYTTDKEATCTAEGSKSIHCTNCEETQYSTAIPAKGHSFGEWTDIVSDACGGDSYSKRVCSVCNATETMNMHPEAHSWSDEYTIDKEATCTEEGSKSIHCTKCDATQYSTNISTKSHSFSEWIDVTADKCGGDSYSIRTCSVCNAEEKINIHAEGHAWDINYTVDKEATCTEVGSTSVHCTKCSAAKYVTAIPAAGHTDADKNGYCDICNTLVDALLANPCLKAVIKVAETKKLDYRTKVTIKATATGVPEGYILVMTVGDKEIKGSNTEVSYSYGEIKGEINYSVKVVDENNNIQVDGNDNDLIKSGKITCNKGFFKKVIAFFKSIFRLLPKKTVEPGV